MPFVEPEPGVLVVTYQRADEMKPALQGDLLARLEQKRPTALVFEVGAAVRSVPIDVPTFWLGVTGRAELQLKAMAIVTKSAAVRVAAGGFALANTARRVAMDVKTFESMADARAWALSKL